MMVLNSSRYQYFLTNGIYVRKGKQLGHIRKSEDNLLEIVPLFLVCWGLNTGL